MSIEEFNSLIKYIETAHKINEAEIARRLSYNSGYISQIRSRKQIPDKFIRSLKLMFLPESGPPPNKEPTVLEEPTVDYQKQDPSTHDSYLLSIIKTQAETILSQQTTIQTLISQPAKKSA
jgi:hypothetical protein